MTHVVIRRALETERSLLEALQRRASLAVWAESLVEQRGYRSHGEAASRRLE